MTRIEVTLSVLVHLLLLDEFHEHLSLLDLESHQLLDVLLALPLLVLASLFLGHSPLLLVLPFGSREVDSLGVLDDFQRVLVYHLTHVQRVSWRLLEWS